MGVVTAPPHATETTPKDWAFESRYRGLPATPRLEIDGVRHEHYRARWMPFPDARGLCKSPWPTLAWMACATPRSSVAIHASAGHGGCRLTTRSPDSHTVATWVMYCGQCRETHRSSRSHALRPPRGPVDDPQTDPLSIPQSEQTQCPDTHGIDAGPRASRSSQANPTRTSL